MLRNAATTSSMFALDNIKYVMLRCWDVPHFSHLTTSNTSCYAAETFFNFCTWTTSNTNNSATTASVYEFDNIRNRCILRHIRQKWKLDSGAVQPRTNAFCDFSQSTCLRMPRKSAATFIRSAALVTQNHRHSAKLLIRFSKMQPVSGNQRPDLLTSLMNMTFVLRLPREMPLWRCTGNATKPSRHAHFWQAVRSHALATRQHVWMSKRCSVPVSLMHFCTSIRASRHYGVHFVDVSTTKSGPKLVCFVHFYVKMCFAPQLRVRSHLTSGQNGSAHAAWAMPTFRPSRCHKWLE